MKTKTFTPPHFRPVWLKLFAIFLSSNLLFFGCDQAKDEISPGEMSTTQVQTVKSANAEEDKDEKYKTDKTGQYVSKDVQVTGYDGTTRPTRPKYDALYSSSSQATTSSEEPIDDCPSCPTYDEPCIDCGTGGGTYTPPTVTSTFVSSEGFGYASYPNNYQYNPTNAIQDLKITKGSSSSVGPLSGYFKINADLNRGAGGQYIYLQFTRDPSKVVGSSNWVSDGVVGRYKPVKGIIIKSSTFGGPNGWANEFSPPVEVKDAFGYHTPDLNDGAGGKYIYAFQEKYNPNKTIVYEVGVLYGSSSSIQPPAGWTRISGDLNEGAGGDYIYFCVKY